MTDGTVPALPAARRSAIRGAAAVSAIGVICNIGILAVPVFNMEIFNRVLPARSLPTLWAMAAGLVILMAAYAALDQLRLMAMGALADRLSLRLSTPLLAAAATLPPARVAEAMQANETLRQFVGGTAPLAAIDLVFAPILLSVLLLQHWAYAALAAGCAATLGGLTILGDVLSRTPLMRTAADEAAVIRDITGACRAADAVLAMGMLPALQRRWARGQATMLNAAARALRQARAIATTVRTLRLAMTGAMVALGLLLVIGNDASAGSMVLGNMILARLLLPFEQLAGTRRQWAGALAAWASVRDILKDAPADRPAATLPAPRGEIVAERLVVFPRGAERPLLQNIAFTLPPGDILGVIGPSGSGKSTLLRAVLGIAAPTAGGVFLDGYGTALWDRADFARHVGFVPQSAALLDGTIAENISRFGPPDRAEVARVARLAGLHDAICALPAGYATPLTPFILSGGQRQRLAIARALYGRPQLVLWDEPTAYLDADGEALVASLLGSLRRDGIGSIIVTHRPALIASADMVLVLSEGRVERLGKREDIVAPPPIATPAPRLVTA